MQVIQVMYWCKAISISARNSSQQETTTLCTKCDYYLRFGAVRSIRALHSVSLIILQATPHKYIRFYLKLAETGVPLPQMT